jgi:hypothetical protein
VMMFRDGPEVGILVAATTRAHQSSSNPPMMGSGPSA